MLKKEALHDVVDKMAEQFLQGAHVAIELRDENGNLPFNTWLSKVRESQLFGSWINKMPIKLESSQQ